MFDAERPAYIALDVAQFLAFVIGIKRESAGCVQIARHGRQFVAVRREEGEFYFIAPFDGVENAKGSLHFHEPVAQAADECFVGGQRRLIKADCAVGGHCVSHHLATNALDQDARRESRRLIRLSSRSFTRVTASGLRACSPCSG